MIKAGEMMGSTNGGGVEGGMGEDMEELVRYGRTTTWLERSRAGGSSTLWDVTAAALARLALLLFGVLFA